jgi:hypothetical protein
MVVSFIFIVAAAIRHIILWDRGSWWSIRAHWQKGKLFVAFILPPKKKLVMFQGKNRSKNRRG